MRRSLPFLWLLATSLARASASYDFTPVTQQIDALVARESLNGASLIVIRNGVTIYEQYFGSYTSDTRIPIASASKWLSAVAIERLVERGQMHWTDTVGSYFPDAPAATTGITLGQLFSHTSGITSDDADCLSQQTTTLDACARQILALPLEYAPGAGFAYGGNSMQVGGRMAEVASGKSWDQLFQDELVGPLSMPDTDFATGSQAPPYVSVPNPRIAGGARTRIHDYAHVVQMIVQHGTWNGVAYLDPDGVAAMQLDQTHGAPVISTPDPLAQGYGYGEWRNLVDAQGHAIQVSCTGAFGTSPWIDNQTGVAAVFLVQSTYTRLVPDLRTLWANVRSVVLAVDPIFADSFEQATP